MHFENVDVLQCSSEVTEVEIMILHFRPEDKKNISYKLLPKKPTKVLQETLHKLYDRMNQELPRQGHDDVTLEIAPIDQDFKRKHREVC